MVVGLAARVGFVRTPSAPPHLARPFSEMRDSRPFEILLLKVVFITVPADLAVDVNVPLVLHLVDPLSQELLFLVRQLERFIKILNVLFVLRVLRFDGLELFLHNIDLFFADFEELILFFVGFQPGGVHFFELGLKHVSVFHEIRNFDFKTVSVCDVLSDLLSELVHFNEVFLFCFFGVSQGLDGVRDNVESAAEDVRFHLDERVGMLELDQLVLQLFIVHLFLLQVLAELISCCFHLTG